LDSVSVLQSGPLETMGLGSGQLDTVSVLHSGPLETMGLGSGQLDASILVVHTDVRHYIHSCIYLIVVIGKQPSLAFSHSISPANEL